MQAPITRRFVQEHLLASAIALAVLVSILTLVVTLVVTGDINSLRSTSTDIATMSEPRENLAADSAEIGAKADGVAPHVTDRADTIARNQAANAQIEVRGPVVSDVLDVELGPWWLDNKPERSLPEHPSPVGPYK